MNFRRLQKGVRNLLRLVETMVIQPSRLLIRSANPGVHDGKGFFPDSIAIVAIVIDRHGADDRI
jgi:hypothetical protein